MPEALVIGYGNELRGDDAAGPLTAREIAALNRPNLRALAVHQLMPELADPISRASAVVFVDARLPLANPDASHPCRSADILVRLGVDANTEADKNVRAPKRRRLPTGDNGEMRSPNPAAWKSPLAGDLASKELAIVELEPQVSGDYSAHNSDPAFLLGLAVRLYGHCPRAWLAAIPAEHFDFGVPLSSVTLRGIRAAVISIPQILEGIKSVPDSQPRSAIINR